METLSPKLRGTRVIVTMLMLLSISVGCSRPQELATASSTHSWAFAFIQWNDVAYRLTAKEVGPTGEPIGYVDNYTTDETASTEGVFSNVFPEGTAIYAIEGERTVDAITVQYDGKWVRLFNTDTFGWQVPAQ